MLTEWTAAQASEHPEKIAGFLREGKLGIVPTDTLYGLAVKISDGAAVDRMFRAKGRPEDKQTSVLLEDPDVMLQRLVANIPEKAQRLIDRFWPGALTLVLPAHPDVPSWIAGRARTVGVRQPAHPVLRRIIAALGEPITGTSANLTGGISPARRDQLSEALLERVDFLVTDDVLPGQRGSTVLDFTGPELRILREGDLPLLRIQEIL